MTPGGFPFDPAQVTQVIRVESGYGYGVIGADLHVFGNGTPVYLLENWRAGKDPDDRWLRALPSRMLNPKHAVVPFTGRETELTELLRWRDSGSRFRVLWLYGPGGQGKTRLAAEFAMRSQPDGWKTVTAVHGPGSVLPEPGSQDLSLERASGLILMVDYADRWPQAHLTWLLNNRLLHRDGVPTRVVMIARTMDALPAVRASLTEFQADTKARFLDPLPERDFAQPGPQAGMRDPQPDDGPREQMFRAARDGFAARYGLQEPPTVHPPGPLDESEFGQTLAVHIAALVAVDAFATGQRPPSSMANLTTYLLDREHLHWSRLYEEGGDGSVAEVRYRTRPETMHRAVFTAVLTGPLARPAGLAVLESLDLEPDAEQVLTDHSLCYPPADPARMTVLEPLNPDRLAEDFLALTIAGHEADYPAKSWAMTTTGAVLERGPDNVAPEWTPRTITYLASAAGRWPHLGPGHLYPLLRADPHLAISAGSAALSALAAIEEVDHPLLAAISVLAVDRADTDLAPGLAAVCKRVAEHALSLPIGPAERVGILHHLGYRMAEAGRWEEALEATEEATEIQRLSSTADPHLDAQLAETLINLGNHLWGAGQRAESVAAAQRAAAILGKLTREDRPAHEHAFALSLTNLCLSLAETGREKEAPAIGQKAVVILRRLSAADPGTYEHDYGTALSSLGTAWWRAGRQSRALEAGREATAIFSRLAGLDPGRYQPQLAHSLASLGTYLGLSGQDEAAQAMLTRAVRIFAHLTETNRPRYEPDLAQTLSTLALTLWVWRPETDLTPRERGQRADALDAGQRAVRIYSQLALTNPDIHGPGLARALTTLGVLLAESGARESALAAFDRAADLYTRLSAQFPQMFDQPLHDTLTNRAIATMGIQHPPRRLRDAVTTTAPAIGVLPGVPKSAVPGCATGLVGGAAAGWLLGGGTGAAIGAFVGASSLSDLFVAIRPRDFGLLSAAAGALGCGLTGYLIGRTDFERACGVFVGMAVGATLLGWLTRSSGAAMRRVRLPMVVGPVVVGSASWATWSVWSNSLAVAAGIVLGSIAMSLAITLRHENQRAAREVTDR